MKSNNQGESNFPAGLSQPARRALAGAGLERLEDLSRIRESELKKFHGLGPATIKQLRAALDANGLSYAGEKSTDS